MPIGIAYRAQISINAVRNGEHLYYNSRTAYGATLGELMDNVGKKSLRIAEEIQNWVMDNQDFNYELSNDRWFFVIKLPDLSEGRRQTVKSAVVKSIREMITFAAASKSAYLLADIYLNAAKNADPDDSTIAESLQKYAVVSLEPGLQAHNAPTLKSITELGLNGFLHKKALSSIPDKPAKRGLGKK